MFEILKRAATLCNTDPDVSSMLVEVDGDKVCYKFLDDVTVTTITEKGKILVEEGERPDCQVVIELNSKPFCDVIDSSLDVRELYKYCKLVKGTNQDVMDHTLPFLPMYSSMQTFYETIPEFKKMVDEQKAKSTKH
jgi:hypothetical protein